ncbi:hypothetical protein Tco_0407313 [Tanacetum coccineum]
MAEKHPVAEAVLKHYRNDMETLRQSQQHQKQRKSNCTVSSTPTYDPEPATVYEDEEMSKKRRFEKPWL